LGPHADRRVEEQLHPLILGRDGRYAEAPGRGAFAAAGVSAPGRTTLCRASPGMPNPAPASARAASSSATEGGCGGSEPAGSARTVTVLPGGELMIWYFTPGRASTAIEAVYSSSEI